MTTALRGAGSAPQVAGGVDAPTTAFRNGPPRRALGLDAPTELLPVIDPIERNENGGIGDGLALSISSALNALAGLLSWLIAARIMPQSEFGNATAFVAGFQLIGGVAQLNLGVGLLRWLPAAGRNAGRLIWGALLLIMPLSALAGLAYILIVPQLAGPAGGDRGSFWLGVLLFVLATAGWGVFVVHDFIVVALGKPWLAVWRNGLFAIVRIGLLLLLGSSLGAEGVVLSWTVPIVVWIALGSVVIWFLGRRFAAAARDGSLPSRREAVRFLGPTAFAQLGTTLLYSQVPILVTLRFGPVAGGAFFLAWQAINVMDVAAMFFMNSLAVQTAREPDRFPELSASARKRLLVIFLPLLAVGALLAGPVLGLFGDGYAGAATILQVLMLGVAARLVVAHELGALQALGRGMAYARLQLLTTGLVVVVAALVPVSDPGTPLTTALMPVAIGYVAVQVTFAVAVLLVPVFRRAKPEVKA